MGDNGNESSQQLKGAGTKSTSFSGKQPAKKNCWQKFWECGCLVRCNQGLRKKLKPVEVYFENRGEIVYIGGALPAIFFFILSMVTGGIYVKQKSTFQACQTIQNALDESETIDGYLLGALILQYIYVVQYMNMIFEVWKPLSGILSNFLFLMAFLIASLVWTIIGTVAYSGSACTETAYYDLSLANIIINYIIIGGLLIYSIVIIIVTKVRKNRQKKVQGGQKDPNAKEQAPLKKQESPKGGDQSVHNNQGGPVDNNNQGGQPDPYASGGGGGGQPDPYGDGGNGGGQPDPYGGGGGGGQADPYA